jgi:hypothetical protein
MSPLRHRTALALLLAALSSGAHAQALLDPTRPPDAWLAAEAARKNPASKSVAKATEEQKQAPVQLVLSGPTRRFAIVRGELVGAGSEPNASRLIELKPGEVVIESKEGRETLEVFPGVEKAPATPPGRSGSRKEKQ